MSFIAIAFLYSQFWAPTLNEVHTAATQCAAQFCSRQEMFSALHWILTFSILHFTIQPQQRTPCCAIQKKQNYIHTE